MNKHARGFGLIELMVAMALGLVVLLGVTQIFLAAKNTYLSQNASAAMQEDARYALSKMVQEIRMVGMFGCLSNFTALNAPTDFLTAYSTPLNYSQATSTLTLLTGDVGTTGGAPTWTAVTDCRSTVTVSAGTASAGTGQVALPIRRVIYTYNSTTGQLMTTLNGTTSVLLSNVSNMSLLFGITSVAAPSTITSYTANPSDVSAVRSVRISLTLTDPTNRVKSQAFSVVAAIRNRLP